MMPTRMLSVLWHGRARGFVGESVKLCYLEKVARVVAFLAALPGR
jgi:hypothetical protein